MFSLSRAPAPQPLPASPPFRQPSAFTSPPLRCFNPFSCPQTPSFPLLLFLLFDFLFNLRADALKLPLCPFQGIPAPQTLCSSSGVPTQCPALQTIPAKSPHSQPCRTLQGKKLCVWGGVGCLLLQPSPWGQRGCQPQPQDGGECVFWGRLSCPWPPGRKGQAAARQLKLRTVILGGRRHQAQPNSVSTHTAHPNSLQTGVTMGLILQQGQKCS